MFDLTQAVFRTFSHLLSGLKNTNPWDLSSGLSAHWPRKQWCQNWQIDIIWREMNIAWIYFYLLQKNQQANMIWYEYNCLFVEFRVLFPHMVFNWSGMCRRVQLYVSMSRADSLELKHLGGRLCKSFMDGMNKRTKKKPKTCCVEFCVPLFLPKSL